MKNLLIISYYWPPAGGPGVQRWVKLSKYLSRLGYKCHVVTVDENYASYPTLDASMEKEIDAEIRVTKTKSFEALKVFSSLFKKEKVPYAGIPDKKAMSFTGKLALYIRSNFFIPDARVGWNKYALKACRQIIEREKIDVIITTSPPHSTQLIGLKLKKQFPQLKWLADLRDPWTDIYYYDKLSHTPASKEKDLKTERSVLEQADVITTVSEDLKRMFLLKSGQVRPDKISVIPNGFDEDDFKDIPLSFNDVFTIRHTGTINSNYNITGFLNAVKRFKAENNSLDLHFVGNVDAFIQKLLKDCCGDRVKFTSYVTHTEAIIHMKNADLLLLAIPDNAQNKGILTGKLFEYLAAQKPILGIGPADGDAAAIILECEAGKMFGFMEEEKIYAYLKEVYAIWKEKGNTELSSVKYQKYSRREQAGQFAGLIG